MGWFFDSHSFSHHINKMKNRFIFLFLFFMVAGLWSSLTHAVTVKGEVWYNTQGTSFYGTSGITYFKDYQTKCAAYYATFKNNTGYSYVSPVSAIDPESLSKQCFFQTKTVGYTATDNRQQIYYSAIQCPAGFSVDSTLGKTVSTVTCSGSSCPAGYTLSGTSCVNDCESLKGQKFDLWSNCSSASFPSFVCAPNNCLVSVGSTISGFDKTKSCYFEGGTGSYTGSKCSGQPSSTSFSNPTNSTPPVNSPESECMKNGQSYGTVNGQTVCVPRSSTSATPTTVSSQSTSSSSSTSASGSSTEAFQTVQDKDVTADGENVKVRTEITNPDGSKTTEEKVMTQVDFCEGNPNNAICKKNSSEEDSSSACEDNPDLPQCIGLGSVTDTDLIPQQTKTISFAPKTIVSASSCPASKSVSIAGHSMTVSYDPVCNYATAFKPFITAFAYLSAAMFIFIGFRNTQT